MVLKHLGRACASRAGCNLDSPVPSEPPAHSQALRKLAQDEAPKDGHQEDILGRMPHGSRGARERPLTVRREADPHTFRLCDQTSKRLICLPVLQKLEFLITVSRQAQSMNDKVSKTLPEPVGEQVGLMGHCRPLCAHRLFALCPLDASASPKYPFAYPAWEVCTCFS